MMCLSKSQDDNMMMMCLSKSQDDTPLKSGNVTMMTFWLKLLAFQLIPFASLLNIVLFNPLRVRNELLFWANNMRAVFTWRSYMLPNSQSLLTCPCVYLINHRESIDFAIDAHTTGGRAAFVSRMGVGLMAPFMAVLTKFTQTVFYFVRRRNLDKEAFVHWLHGQLRNSPYQSLIIYPEGTRRPFINEPTRIKDGCVRFAYRYKLPIQIIITKNKEDVLSLKRRTHQGGVSLLTYMSSAIDPDDYSSFELYRDSVMHEWERCWNVVYPCVDDDSPPTRLEHPARYEPVYKTIHNTWKYQAWMLRIGVVAVGIFWFMVGRG